ncbi:MAG: lipoate--protein ligase family protein [Anaerolineae bacterium]|nr:lipoate--protein ligase family protein [Anaerolineae bacterium]MBL6965355.1 lipoate--protein ligase family protein [Anaerolineales bacterium]
MTIHPTTWRLIKTAPAFGAWNMAVDEALLESIGHGDTLPTLRLYAWDPPCLSIGYAQSTKDADLKAIRSRGWHLVRRLTGGRAILHTDELTYSVTGPASEPRLAGSVIESYQRISQALLRALHFLALPAQALPKENDQPKSVEPICFEAPSHYEITVAGKKLIGSAQARKKKSVLQHGTLPLYGDLTRITHTLNFPSEVEREQAAQRLLARATTVEAILQRTIPWEEAAAAFEQAFAQTFAIQLELGELTPAELGRAEELVNKKYAHPDWNERI